jgi:hypothetical protein
VKKNEEFAIDKTRLDEAWEKQIELAGKYAEQLADAKLDLDCAKSRKEVKEAELDLKVRKYPKKFGLKKTTEASIKQAVIILMSSTDELEAFFDAKHKVALLQAAVSKVENRKKAMEDMVYLFSIGYFGAPKTNRVNYEKAKQIEDKRLLQKALPPPSDYDD